VQDGGRFGYAHLGISPCGAADRLSMRIANRMVGNDEYAPALEMTLMGATLEFESDATIALAGANCGCVLAEERVGAFTPLPTAAGMVLHCGSTTDGARTYLAVRGGIEVPLIMGSASTDVRGKFGGGKAAQGWRCAQNQQRWSTATAAGAARGTSKNAFRRTDSGDSWRTA